MGTPSHPQALVQLDGGWFELSTPVRQLVATIPDEVVPLLDEVEVAAAAGYHVAGFVAYEAARAFALECHDPVPGLPLAVFTIYERIRPWDDDQLVAAAAAASELDWRPLVTARAHTESIGDIRRHLAAGDTYQANLTFPFCAAFAGHPFALFARLVRAQRPASAAYLETGRFAICSASPERFFARDGDRVVMQPMKGTAPRGRTLAEDGRRAAALRRSPKERAENLMIVDMVRNDLGRIARVGTVETSDMFRVERFPPVLQMTSTVSARTDASLAEVFAATFPCASVTGAPKVRTAAILRGLEPHPRGVYTGAVGYAGPGRRARFNVAIRTATVDRVAGHATFGVGSGIVWDSRAGREYAECLAKARMLHADVRPFSLLETMRWDPGEGIALEARHFRRLASAAHYYGVALDTAAARSAVHEAASGDRPLRLRLLVDERGRPTVETFPLAPAVAPVRAGLAPEPVDLADSTLYHKTTRREVHERAKAARPDCDQVILWNERDEVTETDIGNLALYRAGEWVTPPVSAGLLAGTMRGQLIAGGRIREGTVTVAELTAGAPIAVFNSVRGWQEATFVP